MFAKKAQYRLRQFQHGWHATVTTDELTKAAAILPPAAFVLFQQLPIDGQRHSLDVLKSLEEEEEETAVSQPLAIAALLHDVGKAAAAEAGLAINLWWRGPLVLLETFVPALLTRLCSSEPQHGWRYLLYVHQEHPAIGAHWAAETGCSALACWLIAHHQDQLALHADSNEKSLLARLQRADNLH